MLAVKRVVSVVVMVYLLLALLFLLFPAVRSSMAEMGSGFSPEANEAHFLYVLAFIGVVVMALQLVVENIDSTVLRSTVSKQDGKINELKAKLYDVHQPLIHPTPTPTPVAYPSAAEAAATEQRRPAADADSIAATPPTY